MTNEFNAEDILKIAVKIEQNGAIFYREAAGKIHGEENQKFLLDLAAMEVEHEATFLKMQKQLKEAEIISTTFDPFDENALYLKALADTEVFTKNAKNPGDNFKSILTAAVQIEKDSIVFYLGMKKLVPEKLGKSSIDGIIQEEMRHISLLAGKLVTLND